ncbi:uncharacterized protein LOC133839028 isoform X1 [Drosophila sulfurigaster albostrigata]|uniref:uncharacterized protein LOC133839028 isoform X1 n=1 Tax=Drosophila sulfurigaster albostrigata TaxID=89887 RepID=UPI002D219A46|nr:uncharacterized protein LOC133839028 isoform X1 [Drosophila sulfurigaster albostrigata]
MIRLNNSIILIFFVLCALFSMSEQIIFKVDGFPINLNDILNAQIMPANVFLLGLDEHRAEKYTQDFLSALQRMEYHRKMMQQFMASDYLTNQIIKWKMAYNDFKIDKRFGKLQNENNSTTEDAENYRAKKFLYDIGSSHYNEWLKRTTTLDDIRRQLLETGKYLKNNEMRFHGQEIKSTTKPHSTFFLEDNECDDGDITGYAYDSSHHLNLYPQTFSLMPRLSLKNTHIAENTEPISKSGYETSYANYEVHDPPAEHINAILEPTKLIKEISLKDITDIALTTLAFLSFGMFVLQVLMCITMVIKYTIAHSIGIGSPKYRNTNNIIERDNQPK